MQLASLRRAASRRVINQVQHKQLNPVHPPTYCSACLPSKLRRVRVGEGGEVPVVGGSVAGFFNTSFWIRTREGNRGTPQVAVFPNVKKDSCNSDKTIATIFFSLSLSRRLLLAVIE